MSSSSTDTTLIDVVMPQMGVSVSEGTIVEWRKQVGDWVEYEEAIVDISTDKIDTEVPVAGRRARGRDRRRGRHDGRRRHRARAPGHRRQARPAARLRAERRAAHERGRGGDRRDAGRGDRDAVAGAGHGHRRTTRRASGRARGARRYSPVVQRIAAEHDVDLDQVQGTGRDGRVRKQDVLAFIESGRRAGAAAAEEPPLHIESPYKPDPPAPKPAAAPRPPPPRARARAGGPGRTAGAYQPPAAAPLSRMRKLVGEHMKRSLETAATCTTWIEADMSRVERARREAGLTALPFVARATIDALREYPALNAWLEGDQHTVHSDVNLGIAVSLGEDGLIVPGHPVARRTCRPRGCPSASRSSPARRARAQLRPDDVQGGTFTITNPGQFGSVMATPVINQPQVAILDLEAVVKRPVVVTDEDGNDSIAIRPMTVLGLSWDHRALDGALAAQFLAAVKRRLESL